MKRREIKNLNDFMNIGNRHIIYSDYDNDDLNVVSLSENIMNRLLDDGFLIRWYKPNMYYIMGVYDTHQSLKCYITFFDDYVVIDLNVDLLIYDNYSLKIFYNLFSSYYYYD